MIDWFAKHAPIRVKFRVMTAVHAALGLVGLAAVALASQGFVAAGFAAAFVALVGTVATVAIGGKLICDPYVETVVSMEQLAAGDLERHFDHADNGDCVGRMVTAMATFRDNARTLRDASFDQSKMVEMLGVGLSKLADGQLLYRIEDKFPGDHDELRHDFNRAMDSMANTMGSVTKTSQSIHAGAAEIRSATNDLSQRTEQQASNLAESATAMNQITGMVKETSQSAGQVTTVISDAHREASEGGAVVEQAVEAMSAIEKSAQEITQIINVIDGIAFQTNLLALNAGVEAARAGDAGKGFAVVANEVRALAQRSAEAAKDIKALIMTSAQQVEQGVALVGETGSMLNRIVARVGEISALVSSISESSVTQSAGLQQVNVSVSEMDKMTQQNAAMVEETTAAARSLAREADELSSLVTRFNIGKTSRTETVPAQRPAARAAVSGNLALAVDQDDWSEF